MDSLTCKYCGKELKLEYIYCPRCGKKIEWNTTSEIYQNVFINKQSTRIFRKGKFL
jgi:predicted amidophosphoribosyltransferase